jgi:hypothetical protein
MEETGMAEAGDRGGFFLLTGMTWWCKIIVNYELGGIHYE